MDQAKSTHQAFLRYVRERGENANLDRSVRLRGCGDHKKGVDPRRLALHFSTDFVRPLLRENSTPMRLSGRRGIFLTLNIG